MTDAGTGSRAEAAPTIKLGSRSPLTHSHEQILVPGEPFGSRYHIIRVLGAGGMGMVFQAWDAELAVTVALKVIRPHVSKDPFAARELERRFKRELLLAREVTHNNVVRIHDLGEIDGIKYITMTYVEGEDLATILDRERRLPTARALHLARGVVSGLCAAHEAGVVHRDLKPANIMVDGHDQARIMDFGIARSTSHAPTNASGETDPTGRLAELRRQAALVPDQTIEGSIVGTVEYMAPEQALGKAVDQRADIYALGLILYDMLGGVGRAARSQSAISELTARMHHAPASIRTINPDVPEALERVIARCLEPDPDARYATTRDLEAELQRLDDEGRRLPVLRRFSSRQLAGAAVLVASLLGVTFWLARGPAPVVELPPTSVLISDFDNRAGDAAFEGAVEQALATSLEGASFITVYPRSQAQQAAAQIGGGARIDEAKARLISRREGIKVVVTGKVESIGSRYRVTATALDPALDGQANRPLATATADADNRDGVLRAAASVAADLRADLGDKAPESERLAAAETFTAGSLEAMRAYVRAQELALANRNKEALAAYEEAIAVDPNFGRAYTGMAVIYSNFKDHAKAEEYYQRALKHADRMTEREKYRTYGAYYLLAARNYEKASETYEKLVELYPADDGGHGNLALARLNVGNVAGAVAEVRKSLDIYPRNSLQRYNYAIYSLYAGDFDTAINETLRLTKENPGFEYSYIPFGLATLEKGDVAGARKAYATLETLSPQGLSFAKLAQADLEMYLGRYPDARVVLDQGIARDLADKNNAGLAQKYMASAEMHLALGQRRPAIEAARRAVRLSKHESILFPAARALIAAGEPDEAVTIATELENMLQRQTVAYARLISGEIALANGRLAAAIEAFSEGKNRHDSWFSRFLLGRTYAEAGRYPEALSELELCLKRRGEAADVFFYDMPTLRYLPPVYYWLARTQEALGNAEARKNYEQYLKLRGESVPPDKLLSDVRRRLAQKP
jgi:serine/threonine protein kinase/tetratricopeptide (TPR) repeat protein